ncbi:MAG: DsrE family protein [Candidatus Bathyarchaeota archaeon]|nr:MAG: DsrE family protein [Candidatus Bathyarchaeota archaeon]
MSSGVDQLETITMILQSAPYGDERIWNAFRLARALTTAVIGMNVNIFLTGDAVTTAKRGQKPPESYYNLEKMLKELIGQGVKAIACRTCIAARGLTQDELIEGVQIGTTVGTLAKWVKESQKVLSY